MGQGIRVHVHVFWNRLEYHAGLAAFRENDVLLGGRGQVAVIGSEFLDADCFHKTRSVLMAEGVISMEKVTRTSSQTEIHD
jgi:hypothetical protein